MHTNQLKNNSFITFLSVVAFKMSTIVILFCLGVRALLIDKDQKPRWVPPTINEVTSDHVESYFSKLPDNQELRHKL